MNKLSTRQNDMLNTFTSSPQHKDATSLKVETLAAAAMGAPAFFKKLKLSFNKIQSNNLSKLSYNELIALRHTL